MYQGTNTVDRLLEGARQVEEAAVGATPLVEIYHEGEHLGTADPKLARAAAMAVRIKRMIEQAQEQLDNYLAEVRQRLADGGFTQRPLSLVVSGEGRIIISLSGPSVKVEDPKGLFALFGEAVFDLLTGYRPSRELREIALSADHPRAEEVRKCLRIGEATESMRVKTRV